MKLLSLLRKFSKDKKGSTAIGLGLTFTMVTGATIGAIEIEQMQKARNIMQDKLDATILYLGNSDQKVTPQDAGEAYFRSTIEATDLNLVAMEPVFTYDSASGKVTGTVDFEIKALMTGGLIDHRNLQVKAVATPKTTGTVEIAMVLDVSGSMGWEFTSTSNAAVGQRRIDGLFEASTAMFDVIYQNPQAVPAVAVIPYATSVDITDLVANSDNSERSDLFKPHQSNLLGNLYSNLGLGDIGMAWGAPSVLDVTPNDVTERDHEDTLAVYPAERFVQKNGDGSYQVSLSKPKPGKEVPVYSESRSEIWTGWNGSKFKVTPYWGRYYYGGSERPYMGVMPMTKNIEDVRSYVASFEPSGGTAGHIGTAWGLYALTPAWNDTFDHPAGKPMAFDETTEKYLVVMTDGQFNSQKTDNMSDSDMYAYFQSVCSKARDKGVRVFTVGLLVDDNTETQLSACAGTTGKFYSVDNRLQLVDAFKSIGRETGELRLSH